jgi:hypothetical protein
MHGVSCCYLKQGKTMLTFRFVDVLLEDEKSQAKV